MYYSNNTIVRSCFNHAIVNVLAVIAVKTSSPPPGLEPGSSDCRSGALPLSYRVRQVFTAYVVPL